MTRAERAGAYTLHFEGQTAKYVARTHDEFCRLEGALGGGHVRILFDGVSIAGLAWLPGHRW